MNKLSRRIFLSGSTAVTVVGVSQLVTSCGNNNNNNNNASDNPSSPPATPTTGEVNLYSSRHYNTDTELYNGFTKETGIKVNLVEGKADELIERIKSEGENTQADVFMTVDVARLWRAEDAAISAPTSSAILEERIPASLRDPNGLWFGFTRRARVIMYNQDKVKPEELSTYEDLAAPKWKGLGNIG